MNINLFNRVFQHYNPNTQKKKKFKEVEATFIKLLPDQFPNWGQIGYEWVYEEIYGADFSPLTKAMEEGYF